MSDSPWSLLEHTFLHEGDWAIGQGIDAPDRQALRTVLRSLLFHWGGISMLEVGPGAGIELEGLQRDGLLERINYKGYDLTPEFVAHCRKRFPQAHFIALDVDSLEEEGTVDIVWARHVVEHVHDPYSVIERLWRACREATLISWFIRPTFHPDEVGCGISDGFRHWHLDARQTIEFVADLGAQLRRYDFDHHGTQASLWALTQRDSLVLSDLDQFFASRAFLDALLPATPDPRVGALEDVIVDAIKTIGVAAAALARKRKTREIVAELQESQERYAAAITRDDDDD